MGETNLKTLRTYGTKLDEIPRQRRKIGPTYSSVSGYFAFRSVSSIPYESTLERDFLVRTEFSRSVLDVIPQPIQVEYLGLDGRGHTYTPDFLVYYRTVDFPWGCGIAPLLVEVKPRRILRKEWRDMRPKFKAALGYARERGWRFSLQDEFRIHDQVFENVRFLARYKRMEFPPEETAWILNNLREMGQAPFHYLLARHFCGHIDTAVGISHLWHLLVKRLIDCDMTLPLTNNTVLWTCDAPEDVR